MIKHVLVIGATGGIGSACCHILEQDPKYQIHRWSSKDMDLNHPDKIFETDLSVYDIVINCAAHNQGTFLGFMKNSWQNQLSQIMVNYVSNLFLLKHYANSRKQGQYVWCSTDMGTGVTPYKSVYLSTKVGSQFAMDLVRQEIKHVSILEAQFKSVKTNLRFRNFQGTLTKEQVNATYKNEELLGADYVATKILQAMEDNLEKVLIQ